MKLNTELIEMKGKYYEKHELSEKLLKEVNNLKKKLSSSEGSFDATNEQMQILKDELRNADTRAQVCMACLIWIWIYSSQKWNPLH